MTLRRYKNTDLTDNGPSESFHMNESDQNFDTNKRYYVKELLESIGWDLIETEIRVEEGVPLVKRNGNSLVFDTFDNIINPIKIDMIASKICGSENDMSQDQLS